MKKFCAKKYDRAFFFFFFLENCTISLCSWPKLQIAHFGIKINLEIHVVGLIYKSLNEIKLC
jgi:hypothetical protein